MASMRLWVLASVVFSIVTLPVGCSSSEKSPGGSGGSGGSAGADSGSGNGGTSGSGGAAGASCHGDKTKWAAATGTISCSRNSDCCVVINSCVNAAQVVSKQDYDSGIADQWAYCDNDCNFCMVPAVDVVCSNGQCGLRELDPADASADKTTSRCGVDSTPVVGPVKPLLGCN
jgi:hypothetical protein